MLFGGVGGESCLLKGTQKVLRLPPPPRGLDSLLQLIALLGSPEGSPWDEDVSAQRVFGRGHKGTWGGHVATGQESQSLAHAKLSVNDLFISHCAGRNR